MKSLVTVIISMTFIFHSSAQLKSSRERKLVREGNALYEKGKFGDAETQYRKGLEENKSSSTSAFNLGDALYRQKKYSEAATQFQDLSGQKIDKQALARAYHNLGNSLMKDEKYGESVNAYKRALLNNPNDNDTRYNLAYALEKLKKQQQQQQQQNKDKNNKDNKDKKDQKQKQDQKNKDQKDKNQQNDKQQNDKEQQQKSQAQQQQQQKPKISKEDAERILAALKNDEKDLQKRMQKKDAVKGRVEKNW